MIPFLKNVANAYYKAYGQNVSNYTFVFPSRRAGKFFQKYLAESAGHPIFSPEILTVTDLFAKLGKYRQAERIEMLFTLYEIYKDISKSAETFDEFLYWGEMVLNDFDDVDKYMADAQQLFRNIYDLKELDAGFSYLTEDQIAAIRRFWANFLPLGDSKRKKDFFEMWEVLYPLYNTFRDTLSAQGTGYEGMIFRDVAESIQSENNELNLPYEKIIFIGLNAHSKSEEILLRHLQKMGIADFYWDYSSPLVRDTNNKASAFIDKNRTLFKSQLALEAEEQSFELPVVESIGIPSSVGQSKYVHNILENLQQNGVINNEKDYIKTAVVLTDENMLLPTIYSIPEGIEKINVTMGYNLSNSSISGLMDHVFNVQRNIRRVDGKTGYYYRFVLSVLSNKYITNIIGEAAHTLKLNILQNNKIIVSYDELKTTPILELIFKPLNHWTEIAAYLKSILAEIQQSLQYKKNEDDTNVRSLDIEREFVIEYYKTINKMENALNHVHSEMNPDTYFKLLKKLVSGINVPFTGEPLSGLQIMGMLETRALDFENLIILSMNEGVFPQRKAANSFIPYNLRKGFGLPTYEHQDSIFSYHFYRLINRAKRIYLLHDSRSEGLQSGEVSRYFSQMKYLYADYFNIQEKIATYEISVTENTPITIRKNEHVQNLLHKFLTGEKNLSASAINMYIDCPLQFYFSIIEELDESDDISETIEANTFGSIFHSIMEWIYRPLHGKLVTADLLHNIRKNDNLLTKEIERSFAKNYFKTDPEKARKLTGQNYLTGEVIRKYVKKVLQTDAKSTPFIYVESERRIKTNYPLPSGLSVSLKGFIDRIDEVRGKTRIVDYKTGKGELIFKDMEQLFDKEAKDRPKAIMQVFMYAYLYLLDNPDKIIEPGIYYLRNLFSKNFMPKISCKNLPNIENFSEYQAEFKVHFDACLEEIFDTETPFSQTTTGKACEWCLFTNICNK